MPLPPGWSASPWAASSPSGSRWISPTSSRGWSSSPARARWGAPGEAFFQQRLEAVEAGGLDALKSINTEDARGCFATGDEALIAEYQRLRVSAVRDAEGYLNAGRAMLRLAGASR